MLGFAEKNVLTVIKILSSVNPLSATSLSGAPLKGISMNNQESKVRP